MEFEFNWSNRQLFLKKISFNMLRVSNMGDLERKVKDQP